MAAIGLALFVTLPLDAFYSADFSTSIEQICLPISTSVAHIAYLRAHIPKFVRVFWKKCVNRGEIGTWIKFTKRKHDSEGLEGLNELIATLPELAARQQFRQAVS